MSEWISVKDRLPDVDRLYCIVFRPNHPIIDIWGAQWNEANQCFYSAGGWFEKDEVTHWMPLPNPPKEQL